MWLNSAKIRYLPYTYKGATRPELKIDLPSTLAFSLVCKVYGPDRPHCVQIFVPSPFTLVQAWHTHFDGDGEVGVSDLGRADALPGILLREMSGFGVLI